MSSEFRLQVPADPKFHGLANDVVARYVELNNIPETDRDALASALAAALDGLGADSEDSIDLACTGTSGGFDITVRSGGRSAVVHHPQPAARR